MIVLSGGDNPTTGCRWDADSARRALLRQNLLVGAQPEGDEPPRDGALDAAAVARWGDRGFGIYIHVPYCTTRCGYCDFNTYTPRELGSDPGADRDRFVDTLVAELGLARRVLGNRDVPVDTVFVGGGTPTLLPPEALGDCLDAVDDLFGLRPGAEVTVEGNPDSVSAQMLADLRGRGFNRISFGMQSVQPHVLATLERTHRQGSTETAVGWAKDAGFERISVDLIYGTPGESLADWRRSLDAAQSLAVSHVSAYALIVEEGTRLARQVRTGALPAPDDDLMSDMYEAADEAFTGAGLTWYELSNWARAGHESQHNIGYWEGRDWWGVGPGAHSHVQGLRWWNVKHPGAYAGRLARGDSPAAGRETLTPDQVRTEAVMLGVRMARGVPLATLDGRALDEVPGLVADGLIRVTTGTAPGSFGHGGSARHLPWAGGSAPIPPALVLTGRGRLLADAVARRLIP